MAVRNSPGRVAAAILTVVAFVWDWALCIRELQIGTRENLLFIAWYSVTVFMYAMLVRVGTIYNPRPVALRSPRQFGCLCWFMQLAFIR
jgi:hypothetical protein